ncbi:uncharacterized protein with NRDE domain [Brevundimonas nasdae]|uniref:NRDE family protein n=1 Tax=Brevundimonas nasdae TaxID=172043 RepID=UPI0019128E45|nr:NRDE family protein [Brevundimonas nasdae]MBK6025914.1 NRDE family protein [Brevundimonas nasdae]MDQ0452638.1 uncharacterized protein with NRDE domain [Brevundimonas nasdae]
MCVLALAWRAHPRWRLVLAGNRDELHARPADPLARWAEAEHVIAGRDRLSGGTWLGVSEQGRLAVVTNLRGFGGPRANAPSRGLLLSDMLRGEGDFIDPTDAELERFSPFNLIRVIGDAATFWTNQPEPQRQDLSPGVYGLSNGQLDEPWPKTVRLKTIMSDWLANSDAPDVLMDGLHEDRLEQEGVVPAEPSDAPWEPRVSPIFIRNPQYGTRCSTVVMIDAQGRGLITERRFDASGTATGQTRLEFAFVV